MGETETSKKRENRHKRPITYIIMSGNNNNKKAKTATMSELEQGHNLHLSHLESIRSRLLTTPNVPSSSAAAQAVLKSIDDEVRKSTRDYKLRKKFVREQAALQAAAAASASAAGGTGGDGNGGNEMTVDGDCDEGWQDVTAPPTSPTGKNRTELTPPGSAESRPSAASSLRSSPELITAAKSPEEAALREEGSRTYSPLGQSLSEVVTRSVADSNVRVSSPLAAVALALHAAMRSDILGFKCTGIPDDDEDDNRSSGSGKKKKSSGAGGFAAPIRELPKTKFLPDNWDDAAATAAKISLRYRKDGLGSTILRVCAVDAAPHQPDGAVSISITSGTTSEPTTAIAAAAAASAAAGRGPQRSFAFGKHVNLAGLSAAINSERLRLGVTNPNVEVKVCPVLHYRDLVGLMTTFVTSFDLGSIQDPSEEAAETAAAAANTNAGVVGMEVEEEGCRRWQGGGKDMGTAAVPPKPAIPTVAPPHPVPNIPQPGRAPRIEDLDPSLRRGPGGDGDFAGDLAPGGILDPSRGFSQEDNRGGLMGPNHPAFRDGRYGGSGTGIDDEYDIGGEDPRMPHVGGTGMTPRFDPFYPPGVGPDLGRGRGGRGRGGRGRGGRGRGRLPPTGGDPNPDHLRPPNDFDGDMFM